MEQRISIVTLGVDDLARSRRFYEALGWTGGQEVEETVFFQAGGQAIVLWSREKLAADAGIIDGGDSFGDIALAHNVRSPEEVDRVAREAVAAGGEVTRDPGTTFYGGYAGCFRDPDGHVWEVAFNPGFPLDAEGNLTVPALDDQPTASEVDERADERGPMRGRPFVGFLPISDAARAKAFYCDVLGLPLREEDGQAVVVDAGGTRLRLAVVEHVPEPAGTSAGWLVVDIDTRVSELTVRGVVFERFPGMGQEPNGVWRTPGGGAVAWFRDLDGNRLSLSQDG